MQTPHNRDVRYDDVTYALRTDFAESHTRYWQRLQAPGTWFTAAQRIAIAQATRDAWHCPLCQQRKQALSPHTVTGEHLGEQSLRSPIVAVAHAIATDASRLTQTWYQSILDSGLTDGEYIEIVGTVVAITSIDSFADALGIEHRPLPAIDDANSQQPDYYRPATASVSEDAWVPMLAKDNANTPEADLWPSGKTGNVIRAMSLVPDEVRTLNDQSATHYLPNAKVRQHGVDAGRALNRSQMELVAGRVSALNACYY